MSLKYAVKQKKIIKNDCFERCRKFFRDFPQLFRFSATFPILRNFFDSPQLFPQLFPKFAATSPKICRNFWESLMLTLDNPSNNDLIYFENNSRCCKKQYP